MYTVLVRKQIHGSFSAASTADRYVHLKFTLPFTPFEGLTITKEDSDYDCTLEEIVWEVDKARFLCDTKSDKTLYNQPYSEPIENIVNEYIEQGWELGKGN